MCSAEKDGIMLFGVRLTVGDNNPATFRKSASMNNLSQYESQPPYDPNAGYASDDIVHPSHHTRERKRGVPWTEEEHRLFLLGLQNVGKGDWRGISRNFVKSRTSTQVVSHAQKYFLRHHTQNRCCRRPSLFDITTDLVMEPWSEKEEEQAAVPSTTRSKLVLPVPPSSKMAELELNGKSLKLSVSKPPISNENFGGGGHNIISVA